MCLFVDEGGSDGTKTITLSPSSGDKIDGQANYIINYAFDAIGLYSDGTTSWFTWTPKMDSTGSGSLVRQHEPTISSSLCLDYDMNPLTAYGWDGSVGMSVLSNANTYFSGNVGIGTATPSTLLNLYDADTPQLRLSNSGEDWDIYVDSADSDKLKIDNGSTDMFTIDSSGNVGIATTSPNRLLHVKNSSAGTYTPNAWGDDIIIEGAYAGLGVVSTTNTFGNIVFGTSVDPLGAIVQWIYSTHEFNIRTHDSLGDIVFMPGLSIEKLRIKASGNVGIGTNAPASALHVVGDITTTGLWVEPNYTGMTTNINVLIEDSTTNQLQFVNGLLIGVVPQ